MTLTKPLVTCHSGYTYAQRPISFVWQNEQVEVVSIQAEWISPEGKTFRVYTQEDLAFDLCYAAQADAWTITPI